MPRFESQAFKKKIWIWRALNSQIRHDNWLEIECGISPWWPFKWITGAISWYLIFKSSLQWHYALNVERLYIASIGADSSHVLQRLDHMIGYQDSSSSNGHQVACPIDIYSTNTRLHSPLIDSDMIHDDWVGDAYFLPNATMWADDAAFDAHFLSNLCLLSYHAVWTNLEKKLSHDIHLTNWG